jgi:hypothetical protein
MEEIKQPAPVAESKSEQKQAKTVQKKNPLPAVALAPPLPAIQPVVIIIPPIAEPIKKKGAKRA